MTPVPRWRARLQALPALGLFAASVIVVVSCANGTTQQQVAHGDVERGQELFIEYGCAACHQVSGVRQAVGRVGPSLDDFAEQRIIAGVLPNTPGHLAAWIQQPSEYAPNTGMPDVGVTDEDAPHLVAFLLDR
jgi:cytochrome c2